MDTKVSLLKFRIGESFWGIDPHCIEGIANIASCKNTGFKALDLMEKWDVPGEKMPYQKILFLKSGQPGEKIGLLAHEVMDIEEIPLECFKKLPSLVQGKISGNCVIGISIFADSFCIILDAEKLV